MAWGEGIDETRLLIAPNAAGNDLGHLLSLQHPKSGKATCYLLVDELLQELHYFKQSYTSWFMGDYVCEDGGLYSATPVDPVFILLPIFDEARMKKGDDPGKFRQLDEIIYVNGYPGYHHLMAVAEKSMQLVCEIKEIDALKFFRLDDSKVLAWLLCKVSRLKQTLSSLDSNFAAQDEKNALADTVAILGEYLKDEPWLKLLCEHYKLDITEVTKRGQDAVTLPTSVEYNPAWSNINEDKKNEMKPKRGGKQGKKAKVETESQNIRDMFTRACRKK